MSLLSRLFAPFARLFGRPARRRRFEPLDLGGAPGDAASAPTLDATVSAPAYVAPAPASVPAPPPQSFPPLPDDAATVEVEEGEEAFEEEERAVDAPDGDAEAALDARPDLDVIVAERHARLDEERRGAEREALAGEQRVRLTDPAGPGTLAETLARLEREGRVTSVLAEDDGDPVLLYTPAKVGPEGGVG